MEIRIAFPFDRRGRAHTAQLGESVETSRGIVFPTQTFVERTPAPLRAPGMVPASVERLMRASEYARELAAQGVAVATIHEPRSDVFLDVSIEGQRFQAFAQSDPYVVRKESGGGWCQLGVATIAQSRGLNGIDKRWMVCKYGPGEGRVDLSMLSDAGRRTFALMFGVPIGLHGPVDGMYMFYASPAFCGLVEWAKRRPRKFKAEPGVSSYLGDWKAVVTHCLETDKLQSGH